MTDEEATDEEAPMEEDEDGYMDGPYYVFTAAYHLKRGYCCGSRCRHCPYEHEAVAAPPTESRQP